MTTRKRSNSVFYSVGIFLSTNFDRIHDASESRSIETGAVIRRCSRDIWFADVEKVRAKTTDELLEHNMEQCTDETCPTSSDDSVAGIPG